MSVLFYATSKNGTGERLYRIVKTFVPKKTLEVFRTIDSLAHKLREPRNDHDIAILVPKSKQELQELIGMNDFLGELRIILVLPNKGEDTVAKAHSLRPRFLTYKDSDFLDVAAVLTKMLSHTP